MNQTEKTIIIICVAVLTILMIVLGLVISNDKTFKERFNIDKPNIFQEMYNY